MNDKETKPVDWTAVGISLNFLIGFLGLYWNYNNRKYSEDTNRKLRINTQKLAEFDIVRSRITKCLDELSDCASEIRFNFQQTSDVDQLRRDMEKIQKGKINKCFCSMKTTIENITDSNFDIDASIFDEIEDGISENLNVVYARGCSISSANSSIEEILKSISKFVRDVEGRLSEKSEEIIQE